LKPILLFWSLDSLHNRAHTHISQDPLLLLPALLSSSFEDLDELSIHIATDCSGKEVILALGEYLEIFRAQLESLHADGKDEDAVKQASKCPLILSIFTLGA
jgi:hypothetical protein